MDVVRARWTRWGMWMGVMGVLGGGVSGCREDVIHGAGRRQAAEVEAEAEVEDFEVEDVGEGWHVLKGSWHGVMGGEVVEDGEVLRLGWGESLTGAVWQPGEAVGPGQMGPSGDFEIEAEARRMDGTDFFYGLTFPARASGECLTLVVGGWGGSLVGVSSVGGQDAAENPASVWRKFEKERWYRIGLKRVGEVIEVSIDGERVLRLETEGKDLGLRAGPVSVCAPFGLATWQSTGEVRGIRWRRVKLPGGR